jgi:hypothetical protein
MKENQPSKGFIITLPCPFLVRRNINFNRCRPAPNLVMDRSHTPEELTAEESGRGREGKRTEENRREKGESSGKQGRKRAMAQQNKNFNCFVTSL